MNASGYIHYNFAVEVVALVSSIITSQSLIDRMKLYLSVGC
jgi:hypothetical protein